MKKIILSVLLLTTFGYANGTNDKEKVKTERVGYTEYKSTGYCLTGRTASGKRARSGMIAVDPRVIPLGSRVEIQGLGTFLAADTGGAIKGRKIDIHMPCGKAIKWGRRTILVKVLK